MTLPLIAAFAFTQVVGIGASGPQMKAPASVTPEKDRCVVTGRVSSMQTGEPLKKATLHLTMRNAPRNTNGVFEQTGYSGTSEADGSFKFEGVEPGEYSLRGEKAGYIQTSYGSKTGMMGGTTLTLQPGQQLTDLKLQLLQQAIVTGRVLDEDGDPVPNVSVLAMTSMHLQGMSRYFPRGQANTDDTGAYRIANLTPGKYYIMTQLQRGNMGMREKPATPGKPDLQPVSTYYPNSLDRTGASAVDLKAGQEMPGVDIRQRTLETFHIRGKLAGASGDEDKTPRMLMLQRDDGDAVFFGGGMSMVGADHTFDIANVAPGSYTLIMPAFNGKKETASQPVEVASADVNDVVVTIHPALTIHGSVELQGSLPASAKDKPLENLQIFASPEGNSMFFGGGNGMSKADGTFSLENVTPGKMKVHVSNEPDGAYIKSIRFGNQEVMGKTVDLTQSSVGEIHVVLHAGAPEISGTAMKKKEGDAAASGSSVLMPASSATILLIPEDLTRNGGSVHSTNTNQNGAFTEKGMAPGVYYAVAVESEDFRSWDDPAWLKQLVDKGTKVEVQENDKKQVQVTMLSAEELQAALTAAGVAN